MKILKIGENEENQRLDKLLQKYLCKANKSFIYKMLRKKNITLNDRKCTGNEKLRLDDEVKIWFSDETLEKLTSNKTLLTENKISKATTKKFRDMIVYEDDDIIIINKPLGLLSQKAKPTDISVNELFLEYLYENEVIDDISIKSFKPSICNRLDRNTTGIMICGKSFKGLQVMNELIKNRQLKKDYLCLVKGEFKKRDLEVEAWLSKDDKNNKVKISDVKLENANHIKTKYSLVSSDKNFSLLLVHLITGKSHQIRASLSHLKYPIVGDIKYGDKKINLYAKKFGINSQMLHSYRLTFPIIKELPKLSEKVFEVDVPKNWRKIYGNMEIKGA